jgi:hypothetical protein
MSTIVDRTCYFFSWRLLQWGRAKSTMGIRNFILRRRQVRKTGRIGLNQSLIYVHPHPHHFFYLSLFNSVATPLGTQNMEGGFPPPSYDYDWGLKLTCHIHMLLCLSMRVAVITTSWHGTVQYLFSESGLFEIVFSPSRCAVVKVVSKFGTECSWSACVCVCTRVCQTSLCLILAVFRVFVCVLWREFSTIVAYSEYWNVRNCAL